MRVSLPDAAALHGPPGFLLFRRNGGSLDALVTAVLLAIAILLGMVSGFTIRRLSSGRKVGTRERKLLEILGWTLMGLWLMLALLLLAWVAASLG